MKSFFVIKTSIIVLLIFSNFPLSAQASKDTLIASAYYKKADSLLTDKKLDSSIVYFKKALNIYQTNNSWKKVVSCYNKIANNLGQKSLFEESLLNSKKALEISLSKFQNDIKEKGDAYNQIGTYYLKTLYFSNAIINFKKALEIQNKTLPKKHSSIAITLDNLGLSYLKNGKLNIALEYFEKSLEIKNNNNSNTTNSHNHIAGIYYSKGEFEKAILFLQESICIEKRAFRNNNPAIVHQHNNIGVIFSKKAQYKEAIKKFEQALKNQLLITGKNNHHVASFYNNLGVVYKNLGKYNKAEMYHKKALTIRKRIFGKDNLKTSRSYNNIGAIFERKQEYQKAIEYQKKALKIIIKNHGQNCLDVARSYNNLGNIYRKLKQYDKAIVFIKKGMDIKTKIFGKDSFEAIKSYGDIADIYKDIKVYHKALAFAQKSLNISLTIFGKKNYTTAKYYNSIAKIYSKSKKNDSALINYKKAIEANLKKDQIYNPNNKITPSLFFNTRILLATLKGKAFSLKEIYFLKNNTDFLNKSIVTYQEIDSLTTYIRQTTQDYEDKLTFAKTVKEIYTDAIEANYLLYQSNKNPEALHQAFYYSEKSKANTLQELLQETNAKQFSGLPVETIEFEHTLKTDYAFYTSQIIKEQSNTHIDSTKLVLYENKLFDIKKSQDSLHTVLENTYPNYYQLKYNTTSLSVADLQKKISENTTLLEFFTTDSITYTFAITKNTMALTKTDTPQLNQSITHFHQNIISKNIKPYKTLATQLYNSLIQPIATKIKGEELIIIPDGALWHLNFELLHTQQEASNDPKRFPYLLRKYAISYANSANVLFANDQRSQNPNMLKECLAFSFSDSTQTKNTNTIRFSELRDNLDDLPGTREEIKAIADIIDGKYYFGPQANESNFKKNANQYSILHLALHGDVDHEHPENSKLYFTKTKDTVQDNLLYSHELFAMDIPAELTVLSACNTGTGKIAKGEGIMSLGNAFQYAGTKSLLLSNWEISDQTTPKIIKNFYTNLKKGMNKSKALQQAKLKYLNTANIHRTHPFYWGGFYIIGSSAPISFTTDTTLYWILGIVVCCIILVLGTILYRKQKIR
ncbi:CHAT domain-containing protein [Aquimarina longa]|uniref:CHAT domain-containing protein n=1 Tax=Aquimarina longa TaxID=1080221 RepID=UPI000783E5C1|nr:CHAT domain-containing protein [Aquimarina longa]